ncbi:MAG: alpha/beta hydrolase [Actinobacteria bacterium]|nr:alpha/beta hydrolase [Actinomycetota bacterium]
MTIFVLVHGAWHGGWSFEPLQAELEARRHTVRAPDLPCDDVSAGPRAYARAVLAATGDTADSVLVGHSLAGLTIPLLPARIHVYLCALVPAPGRPGTDVQQEALDPAFGGAVRDGLGRSVWPDVDIVETRLYRGHERRWAEWAFPRLRPQARSASLEPCPLEGLPRSPVASIVARADRSVSPEWSRKAARMLLGVEPIELDGGHFPMCDRAAELADVLEQLAG